MEDTNLLRTNPGSFKPTVLMPLPDNDFDPTESAVPWKILTARGWKFVFSTEHGNVAQADPNLLKGLLGASAKARAAYQQMTQDPAYQHPIPFQEIDPGECQAILLPGGHSKGMRKYVESSLLKEKVLQFFQQGKVIGTICHGMLVVARTIDPLTGRSVLYGHKVTALPKSIDRLGYWLYRLMRRPYLMYSCSVEEEVRGLLEHPEDLSTGPGVFSPYVVVDGSLVTGRWPVDAEQLAEGVDQAVLERARMETVAA